MTTMHSRDGVLFNVYVLKEPDYDLMMMITYGSLIIKDGHHDCIRMENGRTKNSSILKWWQIILSTDEQLMTTKQRGMIAAARMD